MAKQWRITPFCGICTAQIRWSQACELGDGQGEILRGDQLHFGEILGDLGGQGDGLDLDGLRPGSRRPDGLADGLGDGGQGDGLGELGDGLGEISGLLRRW